jgi:hypothetical protein
MFLHFSFCCIVSWVRLNLLFECGAITVDRAGPLPLLLFVHELANLPNAYQAYPTQVSIEYLSLTILTFASEVKLHRSTTQIGT